MIFRQLFDPESSTYTYVIGDETQGVAAIIDPVYEQARRDLATLKELGLTLLYTIETHIHADHITGASVLKQATGCQTCVGAIPGNDAFDVYLRGGDTLKIGTIELKILPTPGHTNSCVSFYLPSSGMIFTGDTLFINGCGRTDFQNGDAATLYESITGVIFALPPDTLIFPGHDYKGKTSSTVEQERLHNPRLNKGREAFLQIMRDLKLDPPKKMAVAVPANLLGGAA